ncbi:ECF transporter S component [Clostridium sp. AWRP]|uniref:ECF transporter S component n=1 Tax=Clostridium sp. AWRP TaxID=2212991 RepID=UPI000FD7FAE6|nr:ECF transporter S component [Clostridium sp. AWRP]AZV58515.1 ECF transporter S component [Clostridium sp. AWRP]
MEQKRLSVGGLKVRDIIQVSLMAAITYIATAIINIPTGVLVKGVVHMGDSMVLLAAILIGRKKAFLSAAIGMSLFDVLSSYVIWAPFTFLIKGIMAWVAATIAYRGEYNGEKFWNNIIAFIVACIWMVAAYYAAGVLIMHFVTNIAFSKAIILSAAEIPGNIAQSIVGIAIALPLAKVLKRANLGK